MTERERIELLREGYMRRMISTGYGPVHAERLATREFPMPKVKQPRTAHIGTDEFRVVDGEVQVKIQGKWVPSVLTADLIRTLNDLLDNPDEEVEA